LKRQPTGKASSSRETGGEISCIDIGPLQKIDYFCDLIPLLRELYDPDATIKSNNSLRLSPRPQGPKGPPAVKGQQNCEKSKISGVGGSIVVGGL